MDKRMYNALLQTATTAAAGEGSLLMTIVPFALIFIIFYFFLIRPQNKKQKETEKMIAALKKGDKVVTIGGIHGVVATTKEHTIIIKVEDGAKIEFNRSAIATVIADKVEEKPAKKEKKAVEESEKTETPAEVKEESSTETSAE
jgi:preprotein translocase subunit YajC